MTPSRLALCLDALGWSDEQLAAQFGCDEALVEAWLMGFEDVPPKAAAWIETLATVHEGMEAEKPKGLRGKRWRGLPERG